MVDGEAFEAFVRGYGRSLFGTAYLLTGDGGQAEDLVQDTLSRLYPQWDRVMAANAPLSYVRRSLVNRFLNIRRRPSSREVSMAVVPDVAAPGDLADGVSDRRVLSQLMRTLPERQRAALVLRYFHDLADEDIAAALGCRTGTVRSLLSRGLEALRTQVADPANLARGRG